MSVARPLGKFDLADECCLDPRDAFLRGPIGKGGTRAFLAEQARMQLRQRLGVESGAHLAGEAKLFPVVVAQKERAERRTRTLGRGESADREFLFAGEAQFSP